MKKVLYSLLILALAVACGKDEFKLNVTVSDADQLPEGAVAFLLDSKGAALDSVAIVDGSFTFTGAANPETMNVVTVKYPEKGARDRSWRMPFIPEKGTFNATLSKEEWEMPGKNLTNAYDEYQKKVSDTYAEYREKAQAIPDEAEDEAEALYDETMKKIADISKEAIAQNPKNYIALGALQNIIYDLNLEEFDEILSQCGKFVGETESVKRIHDCKVAEVATAEGKPFVDFAGKTPEGEDVKLSDFVGQGRWVLTDFWASWCGPCMREIPNIKKTHETLAGDKFTVLGVAVWETNGDNTKSADRMKEKEMTWPQIFVGDDKTPTDSYGIVGIPTLILFAPDGTIYKRGDELRGEKMLETIREIINQ